MRTSNLLAFSLLVAGGCSAELASSHSEALAVSPDLVIAQVYGGGGNNGSTYKNDYVVLFNRGAAPASLNGLALYYQAASVASTSTMLWTGTPTTLPDVMIAPGASYLVQESAGTSTTAIALPNPDFVPTTGSLSIGSTGGELALASSTTKPGADPSTWVDMVGWGGAKITEGTSAGATTNPTAVIRNGSGCDDTGNNVADFTVATAVPANGQSALVTCDVTVTDDGGVDMQPDLTKPADMVVTTTSGSYTALLNEVKLHPSSKPSENGQEFIELEGSGQLPVHTFVVAISGDTGNPKGSTAGLIDYVFDVSAQSFTSTTPSAPSLMLIKAAATTFTGVASDTVTLNDANLNTAKLGDYTESVVLVTVPDLVANPLVVGHAFPTTLTMFIDSIAVRGAAAADGGLDPVFGDAVLEACASDGTTKTYPASGVSRIITNTTPNAVAAWYGGQYEKTELASEQYLGNVADCSGASGAPEVWVMTPGAPNSPTVFPDLAQPIVDFAGSVLDFATPGDDLATSGGDDLAANVPDAGHTATNDGGGNIKPGGNIGSSGCAEGGHGAIGWPAALLVLGLAGLLRSRRRA